MKATLYLSAAFAALMTTGAMAQEHNCRAIDAMAEEAVTIAMTPDQARALAAGIVAAADNAEGKQ